MTSEQKINVFKILLDEFEVEAMRLYCEDMIKTIPDYIFTIPSSTSMKYHNKTQCQVHGQIYHIIMFGTILNYRLSLKWNMDKFRSPTQRDAMRCVAIFHDAIKCGWNGSTYTVHEHPILAAEWVRTTKTDHDVAENVKEAIANMCAAHSGEWTTNKKSKTILPEPKNAMEFFIHECDYLSSRSNIDMDIPEYLSNIFKEDETNIEFDPEYKMEFGKYKGVKLIDIYRAKPDYIEWMQENIHRQDVLNMIAAMKQYENEKRDTV